ncbi:MAG: c-type cytochrome biogenesis protein CcmI [Zoogloeaceae bacterium]|jgi:cytochrome c-type biogenesis protein CcmH|nr:c-type cytochrome biogenesis protein CcmI [Zoogloeaceae bacterium]
MTSFLIAALLLVLLPLAFIFPVLLKRGNTLVRSSPSSRNLHILREQLAELERERAAGLLSESDFGEAREDLERRLVEEDALPVENQAAPVASGQNAARNAPLAAVLLTLLLVIGGFSGYLRLGTPVALEAETLAHATEPTPEQISGMVLRLEEHLKQNPEDEEGWLNLAQACQMLGRPAEAVAAYGRVEASLNDSPDLLTAYAEALALTAMPQKPDDKPAAFQGKPRRLLLQALKLDPEHPKALFLAGAAAFEAGDKQEAATHWEALLPHVETGSEIHALLIANIGRIRAETPGDRKP